MALTTAQASQDALNIAVALQNGIHTGSYEDVYTAIGDLCAAVILLAETLNVNAATLATSINPASVSIGNRYSGVQAATSPIYTLPK